MMLPHLVLGDYKYLDVFGTIHEGKPYTDNEIEAWRRIAASFDPQRKRHRTHRSASPRTTAPTGRPTQLAEDTTSTTSSLHRRTNHSPEHRG